MQRKFSIFNFRSSKRGFTVYLAMLIAALALSIGLAIYDLTSRELDLSDTATQSQYAIYAADTGAECVLYWDNKYKDSGGNPLNGGTSGAFATSSADTGAASSNIMCAGQDVATFGTPPSTYGPPPTNWTRWSVTTTANSGVTSFTLVLGSTAASACAIVQVQKTSSNNVISTTITSSGFNTCGTSALRVERALQVNY